MKGFELQFLSVFSDINLYDEVDDENPDDGKILISFIYDPSVTF